MDNPPNSPPVARDFVGPHQDIKDLGDRLCRHLHELAYQKDAPLALRAMPFNESEFLKDVLKLVSVGVPFVPGVAGQILAVVLPILSQELGVAAPSTASNT